MKILALSFGRKGQNCDIVAKEALLGAKELGAEIRFINTSNKLIRSCIGCFGCSHSREKGGDGLCVLKDDMRIVEDAILDADGVIIAAPVYSVGPNGQLKCLIDRMGLSHVVDHFNVFDMNIRVNPALHPDLMERVNRLGRNVAGAVGAPDKYTVAWKGDRPGICPACHNDLLKIGDGLNVECPICGMRGRLSIQNGQVKADFPEEEFQHSRMRYGGVHEHMMELLTIEERIPDAVKAKLPDLKGYLARYESIPVE